MTEFSLGVQSRIFNSDNQNSKHPLTTANQVVQYRFV